MSKNNAQNQASDTLDQEIKQELEKEQQDIQDRILAECGDTIQAIFEAEGIDPDSDEAKAIMEDFFQNTEMVTKPKISKAKLAVGGAVVVALGFGAKKLYDSYRSSDRDDHCLEGAAAFLE